MSNSEIQVMSSFLLDDMVFER